MSDLVSLIKAAKEAQNTRLAADRHANQLKKEEENLFQQVQDEMNKLGLPEVVLDGVTATIVELQKPFIANFSELEGYIRENGALDLLQKRLTESAVKARWEDGVRIPGVGVSQEFKLRIK